MQRFHLTAVIFHFVSSSPRVSIVCFPLHPTLFFHIFHVCVGACLLFFMLPLTRTTRHVPEACSQISFPSGLFLFRGEHVSSDHALMLSFINSHEVRNSSSHIHACLSVAGITLTLIDVFLVFTLTYQMFVSGVREVWFLESVSCSIWSQIRQRWARNLF